MRLDRARQGGTRPEEAGIRGQERDPQAPTTGNIEQRIGELSRQLQTVRHSMQSLAQAHATHVSTIGQQLHDLDRRLHSVEEWIDAETRPTGSGRLR